MKLPICILLTLCAFSALKAQEKQKRVYIGVNLGTSLLLNANNSEGTVGTNINLINAGYSFKNNLGINLKWMGAAHIISKDNKVRYGAILIGPMYSLTMSGRTYLDLKVATGLFWVTEEIKYFTADPNDPTIVNSNQSEASISLSNFAVGLALRHNFAKHWSFLMLTEYNSGKHSGASYYINGKHLQAININAGIAIRL